MDMIVYLVHGGLVGIGKLQQNKCQKNSAKDNIRLPPIEFAINIGSRPDYGRFLIIEVGPWRSMNCIFKGMPAP